MPVVMPHIRASCTARKQRERLMKIGDEKIARYNIDEMRKRAKPIFGRKEKFAINDGRERIMSDFDMLISDFLDIDDATNWNIDAGIESLEEHKNDF